VFISTPLSLFDSEPLRIRELFEIIWGQIPSNSAACTHWDV